MAMMKKMMATAALCAAVVMMSAQTALAQDEPKVGLVIAFPSEIGVLWQVSDRIAVRPDVGFYWSEFTFSSSPFLGETYESESTNSSVGVGVSVLFTVARWERLRAYVVPRVSYSFLSGGSATAIIFLGDEQESDTDSSGRSVEVSGSFGVEYSLGDRFAVFGETGLAHVSTQQPSSSSSDNPRSRQAGTRSSVGVVFRF